jgi:hypothetical protein
MLTVAAMLATLALTSVVVGVMLAVAVGHAIPALLGLVLGIFLALPAWIMQVLARQSLAVMYERPQTPPPQIVATEETTTLVVPRVMAVAGRPVSHGTLDVKLRGVKPDDARRMIAHLARGGGTSRRAVIEATGVPQGTFEKIMAALEDAGVATNNGRNGWTLTGRLDGMLRELEDKLE